MENLCPLCGASLPEDDTCRDLFDRCLALEFEQPAAFGAVHFITVTCYMLQHNAYSREVWLEARRLLEEHLRGELSTQAIRRANQTRLDSRSRKFHITRGPRLAEFAGIRWTSSIAAVPLSDPELYCARVRAWAAAILADTRHLASLPDK